MTDHPITPTPQLRQLWAQEAQRISPHDPVEWMQYVSEKAAQWGANTELKACCVLMDDWGLDSNDLMECRRPKPPSLKEQALSELYLTEDSNGAKLSKTQVKLIRRALEALSDD